MPFGTITGMHNSLQAFLTELEQYAAARGVTPQHVARDATKNPRWIERANRRAVRLDEDIATIRAHMAKNPVRRGASQ